MSDEKFSLVFNLKFKNSIIFTFKKIYESFTTGHVVKQYLLNELNEKMPNFKIERIEQNDEYVKEISELSDFYFFNENKELIVHLIQTCHNNIVNASEISQNDNDISPKSSITITKLNSSDNSGVLSVSNYQNEVINLDSQDSQTSSDEVKKPKQDLITDLIRNSEKTKTLPTENGKYLRDWRRRVIKLIGSYILINNDYNPSKILIKEFAEALIQAYPILKDDMTKSGYEHLYDPENHSGFLGWYIRNQRSRNPLITTRTYKRKLEEIIDESDKSVIDYEEIENTICYLKHKFINTDEDRVDILRAMNKTHSYRFNWIKKHSPSLTEIFDRFPKFLEMHYLINDDFKIHFPGKHDNLIKSWGKNFINKLIDFSSALNDVKVNNLISKYNASDDNEKNFILFEILCISIGSQNLKGTKNSKVSKYQTFDFIIQKFKIGTTLEEIFTKCNSITHQPLLVIIENGDNKQYFIKFDAKLMEIRSDFINSVDILFKSFWVFNIDYTTQATYVFYFLEIIFCINKNLKPALSELKRCLLPD